jgi:enoyl-[acyl-carrier protein] reductase I
MVSINLKGKVAFIAGVGDDAGYGWAIARSLADAGATIVMGTWAPVYKIFTSALEMGKFDASRKLSDGSLMEVAKVYPMDATFDYPEEVPEEIKENKRYKPYSNYTLSEVASLIKKDFGHIDILIHSLANAPEVKKPLLETSRNGYLAAMSSSAYSFVSLMQHFGPLMREGGSALNLTYVASTRIVPGYGGGMSSAKAALESDTRTLAFEAGQAWKVRVNTISAGPLGSRAARAIGFIDTMIEYSYNNAPLQKELAASEVADSALFLCSSMASAVTGTTLFVDNGLHAMGIAIESASLTKAGS